MKIQTRGITLIELIVVITIIAILAVVGFPSYQTYLIESRRSDALNALRENQLIVENYLQQYGVAPESTDVTLLTVSNAGFYDISYSKEDENSYKLVATAVVTSSQNNDTGCTTITLISEMDSTYPTFCN